MTDQSRLAVVAGLAFALFIAVVGALTTADAGNALLILDGSGAFYGMSPVVVTGL